MAVSYFRGRQETGGTHYDIFTDQAGYLTDGVKTAVMGFPSDTFRITDENGEIFYENLTRHFGPDDCSGDDVYIADFTDFRRAGTYRVTAGGRTSALFRIGDGVYGKVIDSVAKAFYYLRCGCDLEEKYAGKFTHRACHTGTARIYGENGTADVSGGWHDAGDYGKYVTAGACACAHLLYAYKLFPDAFEKRDLNIPESGSGVPDILSECRYELEWLLKMQTASGSVYHKVTSAEFAPFIMPEEDRSELWLYPPSSCATADFCGVCALASGIFRKYDEEFADKLKNAALKAYDWLEKNDAPVVFRNPYSCHTGEYGEDDDRDNRYWASAELFVLTGEERYHADFIRHYNESFTGQEHIICTFDHTHIAGFGSLAYIFGDVCGKDEKIVQELKKRFTGEGYWLADKSDRNGYGAAMSEDDYFWGSNMALMKHLFMLVMSYRFTGDKRFIRTAYRQISVLLGLNPLGISYVTGTGENCCNYPHLRPAFADGIDECIPGMVVGGPNKQLDDDFARSVIPPGTPPMKCYVDDMMCYSLNEVAIYWNSMTVLALAYFDQ